MPVAAVSLAQRLDSKPKAKDKLPLIQDTSSSRTTEEVFSKGLSELPAIGVVTPVQLFPKVSDICIFTRSYIGDLSLLPELYASIEKNFSQASECILVVEEQDFETISRIVPDWVKLVSERKFAPGTIQHKYSKLTADLHTECEWIFHIDSDTLVLSPIDAEYLLQDGKPIIEVISYDSLKIHQNSPEFQSWLKDYVLKNHLQSDLKIELVKELRKQGVNDIEHWCKDHYDSWHEDWIRNESEAWFRDWYPSWKYAFGLDVWQEGTSYAFGSQVDLEFSQKPIKLYPRQVYKVCREHVQAVHSMSLADFILTRVGKQSYGVSRSQYFSDLNFIGACLYYYYHDSVHWVRTDVDGFDYRETRFNQRISYDIIPK